MPAQNRYRPATAAPLIAAVLLAGWLAYDWTRGSAGRRAAEPPATPVAVGTPDDVERIAGTVSWDGIGAIVVATNADPAARTRLIDSTARAERPEAQYLRALLLLALGRREDALAEFRRIDPAAIPSSYLYAPYRLHATLRPGAPNPYRAGLVAARTNEGLIPIVEARIAAEQGDLQAALQAYMQSDPAQWATRDVSAFRLLRLHAGLSGDARMMLAAAVRGGRIRPALKPQILRLVAPADAASTAAAQRAGLLALLESNADARAVAVASASAQLQVRQRFLARRYRELVADHATREPLSLPDGTLLIVLVSAHEVGDAKAVARWAQEVRRRYPQPEVAAWLKTLTAARS